MHSLIKKVDHLVLAVPVLEDGIAFIEEQLGVKPQIGGQHHGKGTWNALVALGDSSYLEIIAPDPQQAPMPNGCWMDVHLIEEPTMIHWAAKVHPIEKVIADAKEEGLLFGDLSAGSRTKMNGEVISWMLTEPINTDDGMVIPFLIDWEDSLHPAEQLPQECSLVSLTAVHPSPKTLQQYLRLINIEMEITPQDHPGLKAILRGPNGLVELGG